MMQEKENEDDGLQDLTEHQVLELLGEVHHQTILHWNYRRLRALPKKVLEECSHIQQIYLKRNLLTHLPDSFGQLSQLTYCYLHGNNLQALPDSIGELSSLIGLDVGNNKIKQLPATLGKLPSLRSLIAVYNQITSFPEELCCLKTLSVLMLSGNNLLYLPEAIGGLTGLQGLYVDHNYLTELPRSITSLPLLTRISCCCNALRNLPALKFRNKPSIFFDENPHLKYLPFSLIQQLRTGESWDPVVLQTCGCFQEPPVVDSGVWINLRGSVAINNPRCLVLPPQIKQISGWPLEFVIPPLLELCLRNIWNSKNSKPEPSSECHFRKHTNMKFFNLSQRSIPFNLWNLLDAGPVAYCVYSDCENPIFTYSSLRVIRITITLRIGGRENPVPSILYFCSDSCHDMHVRYVNRMHDVFAEQMKKLLGNPYRVHEIA